MAVIAACWTVSPLGVFAENAQEQQEFLLPEMVVTATRTEQTVKAAPSTVQVVTRADIELRQSQTLGDVLRNAMGVTVFNDFQGRSQLRIRGSESRHVLIMIDGRRLGGEISFNSANAYDVDRIRMDNVERVEIIRGPAGALYGSDAMGGVVNIITKKPTKNEGRLQYEYSAWDGGKSAGPDMHLFYQGVNEAGDFSWSVSAGQHKPQPFRGIENGINTTANYYGKEQPIALSGTWTFADGNHLRLDYSKLWEKTYMDSDFSMTASMHVPQTVKNDNTRTDWSVEYGGDTEKRDWQIRAYRSDYKKDYSSYNYSSSTHKYDLYRFDLVDRTLSVLEGRNTWQQGENQRITTGFEWRKDETEGTRIRKPGSMGSSVTYGSLTGISDRASLEYRALYLQDEIKSGDKLLVIPSLRYDWSDKFSSEITPQIGVTYNAQDDIRIKAVVGKGYKTPTVNELYHYFEMFKSMGPANPGQFFAGNPDLKPEKSTDYELSVEKDWTKTSARMGVFRNEVKDLIESYNTGIKARAAGYTVSDALIWLMNYRNVEKATLQGFEGEVSHKLNNAVKLRMGYMYLDAKNDITNARLEDRPRQQINFGITYQPVQSSWNLNLDAVTLIDYLTKETPKVSNSSTKVSQSYSMINFMAEKKLNENALFYVGMDNLTDRTDYNHGILGRIYRGGIQYKF